MNAVTNNKLQIKSKKRVADHGEVFTNEREVNAMLDLVKIETENIESTFLEPACGDGNFLVEILRRKLTIIELKYSKNQFQYERYTLIALSSIYGVDILKDNVQACRNRLLGVFTNHYQENHKELRDELLRSAEFILSKNIIWGDALNLRTPDEKEDPIVFSEWTFVNECMIKRRDYTMANLLQSQPIDGLNLFSDLGDKAFIPKSVGDFPLMHFLKLDSNEPYEL